MVKFDLAINLPTTFDLESNAEQESILVGYVPAIAVTWGVGYTLPLLLDILPWIPYTLDILPPVYPTPLIPWYLPDTLPTRYLTPQIPYTGQ